jgi:invasion protein IalB
MASVVRIDRDPPVFQVWVPVDFNIRWTEIAVDGAVLKQSSEWRCDSSFCTAEIPLTGESLESIKNGDNIAIRGGRLTATLSLGGFAAEYSTLSLERLVPVPRKPGLVQDDRLMPRYRGGRPYP